MVPFRVKKTGQVTDIGDPKTLKRVRADPLAYEEVKPAETGKPDTGAGKPENKKPEK